MKKSKEAPPDYLETLERDPDHPVAWVVGSRAEADDVPDPIARDPSQMADEEHFAEAVKQVLRAVRS
jgi:hypothetical protein